MNLEQNIILIETHAINISILMFSYFILSKKRNKEIKKKIRKNIYKPNKKKPKFIFTPYILHWTAVRIWRHDMSYLYFNIIKYQHSKAFLYFSFFLDPPFNVVFLCFLIQMLLTLRSGLAKKGNNLWETWQIKLQLQSLLKKHL